MPNHVILQTDGASRGNPGPSGAGYVVVDDAGKELTRGSEYVGVATNNVAEYEALLRGLRAAYQLKAQDVTVRMDSQLVVMQLTGRYKVKHPGLRPYFDHIKRALTHFNSVQFEYVPRERNRVADNLATSAARDGSR